MDTKMDISTALAHRDNMISVDPELQALMTSGYHKKWGIEVKLMAATFYNITGSCVKTAKALQEVVGEKFAYETIRDWRNDKWWNPLLKEIRKAKNDELDAVCTKAIHTAVGVVQDRLENGDVKDVVEEIVDGETVLKEIRVPVKMKDAAVTAGVLYDKRGLLRGDVTQKIVKENTSEVLEALAKRFESFSQTIDAKRVKELTTEYTVEE